jgi:hypothetical protein
MIRTLPQILSLRTGIQSYYRIGSIALFSTAPRSRHLNPAPSTDPPSNCAYLIV